MSKNIVVCLDGTWNGPGSEDEGVLTPTNVQKIFEHLLNSVGLEPTDNEKEIVSSPDGVNPTQIAKYLYGVGDANNVLERSIEGASGLGLVERIVRGYTYLSRNYEAGDRIYLIGFSRGAYTARALASLVTTQGLLDWKAMNLEPQSTDSYRAGFAAWKAYKQKIQPDNPGVLEKVADVVGNLCDRLECSPLPSASLRLISGVKVNTVAVWDTVGALGVPVLQSLNGEETRADEFEFCNTSLGSAVAHGFQAISADEERLDFTPTLWDNRDGVVQMLFPGAHSDVGGGYEPAESGLATAALIWMIDQLKSVGVEFGDVSQIEMGANPLAMSHRPWVGRVPYRTGPRAFTGAIDVSSGLLARLGAATAPVQGLGAAPYRPENLVPTYIKADWSGITRSSV